MSDLSSFFAEAFATVAKMLGAGFETAPALMLGLTVIAALPVLVAGGALLRRVAATTDRTVRADKTTRVKGLHSDEPASPGSPAKRSAPAYSQAVIEIEADVDGDRDRPHEPFKFGAAVIVRIGREEDNEIKLKHPTVHRYHALIRRSFEAGYEISDLSDARGNGVIVNGEKVLNAPLANGDEIKLGAARLRFGLTQ
ncbi:MAG: FHA domain-containing protein [Alphaproteobacteria bacterium]|nr:FHA domain-containing protein [Alphaproteobacteria bacterium]